MVCDEGKDPSDLSAKERGVMRGRIPLNENCTNKPNNQNSLAFVLEPSLQIPQLSIVEAYEFPPHIRFVC